MKHLLTFTGSCWAVVLIAVMGLSAYGCSDSVSVSEDVEVPLSSLTITPGSLRPAFSSNTTTYTVNAPTSSSSVTVKAVPKDSTTTMTINGVITTAGQERSVPLGPPGSMTTISIALESHNGTGTTYTITVTRLLSSDNNLSALDVTPGDLDPPFDSNTLTYTVNVGLLTDSVTVSATKSDPTAMMLLGSSAVPPGTASGQATFTLGGPGTTTPVKIIVTAPNKTSKTYTINVVRAASSDNNLSALTVTPGALSPAFASSQEIYTVDVATEVISVNVVATKSDPNAVISGSLPNAGQATIQLNGPGTGTPVSITVTAPNGSSKTYNITINRAAPASDNNLSALTVTGFPLVPDFSQSTTVYSVQVPFSINSVIVTATKSDANAVMSGDVTAGTGIATGQNTITLNFLLPTTVSITITAPNGVSKQYSIVITQSF